MDIYVMDIYIEVVKICISLLGSVLVVGGWFFTYYMSQKQENLRFEKNKELERIRWKKEMIDKQISDFYGPIFALLSEDAITSAKISEQIGRRDIMSADRKFCDLSDDEQKIWCHYVDNYKLPRHMQIVEIIRKNTHLINNEDFSDSYYTAFLEYILGWELLDNQYRNNVPNFYEYHYVYSHPTVFDDYINNTYKRLLREQQELISESEKLLKNF